MGDDNSPALNEMKLLSTLCNLCTHMQKALNIPMGHCTCAEDHGGIQHLLILAKMAHWTEARQTRPAACQQAINRQHRTCIKGPLSMPKGLGRTQHARMLSRMAPPDLSQTAVPCSSASRRMHSLTASLTRASGSSKSVRHASSASPCSLSGSAAPGFACCRLSSSCTIECRHMRRTSLLMASLTARLCSLRQHEACCQCIRIAAHCGLSYSAILPAAGSTAAAQKTSGQYKPHCQSTGSDVLY